MPDGSTHVSIPAQASESWAKNITITALARVNRLAVERMIALPKVEGERHRSDADIAYDRCYAVRDLVLTMPARTIEDALVQAGEVLLLLNDTRVSTPEELAGDPKGLKQRVEQASRGLASIIGALALHCSIPPGELVEEWILQSFSREFGGFEAAVPEAGR